MLIRKLERSFSLAIVVALAGSIGPAMAEMSLEQALEVIRESETVDDGAVGGGAERTETYDAFVTMKELATKEQILGLTANKSANIRAYAAMALRGRFPKDDFFDLLMTGLKDENTVEYFSGCIVGPVRIGDFYFKQFSENLTADQHSAVVGYLLTNDNELETKSSILEDADLPETLLPRVRDLVKEGSGPALIALAKFKREEDYPLIMAAVEENPAECFRSIEMNPQPVFLGVLQKSHPQLLAEEYWSTSQKEFYKAVAAFRNEAALEMLRKPLDGSETTIPAHKDHLDYVFEAISPYQDPVYDGLKWRLWTEFNRIDLAGFKHLAALDMERTLEQTRKTLDHLSRETEDDRLTGILPLPGSADPSFVDDDLMTAMFTRIGSTDPSFVEQVVTRELEKCDYSRYSYFAAVAGKSKKPCYVPALFKGVETNDRPNVFLAATTALFAYGNEDINNRILQAPAKNPELEKGWGGEAFRNLLKNKGQSDQPDELVLPE